MSRSITKGTFAFLTLSSALMASTLAADPGLYWLTEPDRFTFLTSVNQNGSVIVGETFRGSYAYYPGNGYSEYASGMTALSVSQNGQSTVGYRNNGNTILGSGPSKSLVNGTAELLPYINRNNIYSGRATSTNHDGSISTGYFELNEAGFAAEAVRWTSSGVETIVPLSLQHYRTLPKGISADGNIIVGETSDASFNRTAFRWTPQGGIETLPDLPLSGASRAYAISADGHTIVGSRDSLPSGNVQFARWQGNQVVEDLGILAGYRIAEAYDVSDDGEIVIGWTHRVSSQLPDVASIWTQETGHVRMVDYLLSKGIDVPEGVTLSQAVSISGDGSVITGRGNRPGFGFQTFTWVVVVPSPTTPIIIAAFSLLATRRRR